MPNTSQATTPEFTLRDEWLAQATTALRVDFDTAGFTLTQPTIRVSCGFPSKATAGKCRVVGQCWDRALPGEDGIPQIYLSPVEDDPIEILGTLVHELVHAAVGCRHGHKQPFKVAAVALGLTGKMTATTSTPELVERLNALASELGPFPHSALDLTKVKKQTTRLLKVECIEGEHHYTARVSRLMLDAYGAPLCPVCEGQMVEG
jgi:hypothetical protein